MTEPAVGACTWASGSQVCTGHIGIFTAKEAKKGGAKKAGWEGKHPWRPWNRETDLDVRAANPKGKESITKHAIMGTLGDRFGGGRREHTFT